MTLSPWKTLSDMRIRLIRRIASGPNLGERYISVMALCNTPNLCERLRQFAFDALDVSARCCEEEPVLEQDGDTLVLIAQVYRDFDWLYNL